MMEAGSSNTKGSDAAEQVEVIVDAPEPPPAVNTDSGYAIDGLIHARTSWALNLLATGVKVQNQVLSLPEVVGLYLKMEVDVGKVIQDSEEDICKNKELSSLVKECLENGRQILEVFDDLENCLKRARKNQQIVQLAVQKFEEEVLDGGEERKFGKTLDELNKFKAAEKPFEEEFFQRFLSVRDQQVSLLKKLLQKKEVVDKNLKSVKTWRKVSNILFATLFVSTVVFSVVAAAIASSPVVTSVASTLVVPVASLGKWCSGLLNRYENKLEWQKELLTMESFTGDLTIKGTENIRVLVIKMETKNESLLDNANFALGEQEPVKLVIDEMRKTLQEFMKTIEDLGKEAAKFRQAIEKATLLILQKINEAFSQSAAVDSPWNLFYL
ncbi:hypothetical protein SLE2022_026830 [Rubroshorea leprosula]